MRLLRRIDAKSAGAVSRQFALGVAVAPAGERAALTMNGLLRPPGVARRANHSSRQGQSLCLGLAADIAGGASTCLHPEMAGYAWGQSREGQPFPVGQLL